MLVEDLGRAGLDLVGDTVGEHEGGLRLAAGLGGAGLGVREHLDDEVGDGLELVVAEAAGGQRRGAQADAGGVPGAVGVGGHRVAVGDHAGLEQRRLGLATGQAVLADVDEHQVVVGAAGDQVAAPGQEALGQRLGVVGDLLGVAAEGVLAGLGEGDGLGGHHVRERAAEHHRAAAVDAGGVLLGGQHDAAARAAQRLVRGGGDDVGVRDRVLVAGEDLAGHQPGEVGHVDHQGRADLVGDLAHPGEVDPAGVGRVARHQHQRLELAGLRGDLVVVEQPGLGVGAVLLLVEHLAADVGPEAVRQVAAGVEAHAEQALVAQLAAQLLPVGVGELVDVLRLCLLEPGTLDAVRQDRPERHQVGVDARVRLHVGVLGAEQLAGVLGGDRLDGVDVLAAGVEAVTHGALGVLVAEPGAHRHQHGRRGVVLAGDELERGTLVGELGAGRLGDPRLHRGDDLECLGVGAAGQAGQVVGHGASLRSAATRPSRGGGVRRRAAV